MLLSMSTSNVRVQLCLCSEERPVHDISCDLQANKEGKVVRGLVVINPGNPTGLPLLTSLTKAAGRSCHLTAFPTALCSSAALKH